MSLMAKLRKKNYIKENSHNPPCMLFLGAVEFSFSPNMHELLLQAVGIP